jgi:hypothetical protein
MIYTVYSAINGQILRIVQTSNIQEQLQENQLYLEGFFDDTRYYIDDGLPVELPEKSSPYANFDYTTKQWVINSKLAMVDVLTKRKKLLASSDWTQLPDVPLATKAAWATYRQELRDISKQSGYPTEITWPTPPQ